MRRHPQSPRLRHKLPIGYPENTASTVSHTVETVSKRPWFADHCPATQPTDSHLIEVIEERIEEEAYLHDFDADLETLMLPEHQRRRERSVTPTPTFNREVTPTPANPRPQIFAPQVHYAANSTSGRPMNRWEYKVWYTDQLAKHTDPQDDPAKFDPRQYLRDISQFTFDGLLGSSEGTTSPCSTVWDSELSGYETRRRGAMNPEQEPRSQAEGNEVP